jgi:bifunctional DNase/RNase
MLAGADGGSVGAVADDDLQSIDDEDLVLLSVTDVRVAVPAGNGVEAGLVVLEEVPEPHRQLHMYVGQPEARAIYASWSQTVPPRPSTWDLFISTISLLDARVDRAVINDVEEERHYFAQLVIDRAEVDDPLRLTARPSDAIALALRGYGAKLYARPHVLDDAGLLADGSHWVRPQLDPAPFDPETSDDAADADVVPDAMADLASDGGVREPGTGDGPERDGTAASALGPGASAPDRSTAVADPAAADRAAADRAAAARSARSFRGDAPG